MNWSIVARTILRNVAAANLVAAPVAGLLVSIAVVVQDDEGNILEGLVGGTMGLTLMLAPAYLALAVVETLAYLLLPAAARRWVRKGLTVALGALPGAWYVWFLSSDQAYTGFSAVHVVLLLISLVPYALLSANDKARPIVPDAPEPAGHHREETA